MNRKMATLVNKNYKHLLSIKKSNKNNNLHNIKKVLKSLDYGIENYTNPLQEFMDNPSYTDIYLEACGNKTNINAVIDNCHDLYYKAIGRPEKMYEQSF